MLSTVFKSLAVASLAIASVSYADEPASLPSGANFPSNASDANSSGPSSSGSSDNANSSSVHLVLEAMTDFPVDVGIKASMELPYRIRVSLGVGILPGPYIDALNGVLVDFNVYSQDEANLIRAALQSSLVARIHAGWRPFISHGLYFEVGYGLVALGGSISSSELISSGSGKIPPVDPNSSHGYDVKSVLSMIDAEIGWQWLLPHNITLRAAIGFAGTVAASTSVTPEFTPVSARAESQFTSDSAASLNSIYTSYVFTPVFSVGCGYQFF